MEVRSYGGSPLYRQFYGYSKLASTQVLKISWNHLIVKKKKSCQVKICWFLSFNGEDSQTIDE